ncbi:MAG: exodeoxyribonuclease VII small subunit [Lentisphaerae bacterium]|nr:exodeoxyribonuclease VII small subunit [Lentisphaerota bacterium]
MAENKASRKPAARREPGPTFEQALERLEAIVAEMEGGTLDLETMIARFEEGRKLVALCSAKLDEVERKIETLVKEGDTLRTEPMEDDNE